MQLHADKIVSTMGNMYTYDVVKQENKNRIYRKIEVFEGLSTLQYPIFRRLWSWDIRLQLFTLIRSRILWNTAEEVGEHNRILGFWICKCKWRWSVQWLANKSGWCSWQFTREEASEAVGRMLMPSAWFIFAYTNINPTWIKIWILLKYKYTIHKK